MFEDTFIADNKKYGLGMAWGYSHYALWHLRLHCLITVAADLSKMNLEAAFLVGDTIMTYI